MKKITRYTIILLTVMTTIFFTDYSNNDGDWKIDVDQELLNALTGGLSSVGEEMEGIKLNPFGK